MDKKEGKMDRRGFLKGLGSLSAAGMTLAMFPWLEACTGETTRQTAGHKARLGIIGPGSRGQHLMQHISGLPNARIVALCDIYRPNIDEAARMCPEARQYTDYRRLLEDREIDAVVVATPLHLHHRIVMDAFDAGKHVFCEKAMAYTIGQCHQMYLKSRSTGKVFFVGQQRLFDPKYIKAMDMVRRGDLGPVVNVRQHWFRNNDWRREVPSPDLERHINWRLYREYSRGLMTELACHHLQNGTWAMGMLPESVMGTGNIIYWKDGREVFDSVCAIYTFPNGVNMTFESVIANRHFGMGEYILCKDGTVDLVKGRIYHENPKPKSGIRQLVGDIEKGIFSNSVFAGTSWTAESGSSGAGIAVMPDAVDGDGSPEMLQGFVNSVIAGKQPPHVLEEAYYASAFCLLGDEALLQKKTLTLPDEFKIDYL